MHTSHHPPASNHRPGSSSPTPEPRTLNPSPLHPSSFRLHPSRRRRAVTIIEVLFAILITTVGLFSALAIFPFASAQARRARLNDMFAAAGRSAFHSFDTRGMRRPDRWMAWDQTPLSGTPRFVPYLSLSNRQSFESVCIDPRLIAMQTTIASGVQLPATRTFPYQEPYIDANGNSSYETGEGPVAGGDLNNNGTHDPPASPLTLANNGARTFNTAFMRRITLFSGNTAFPAMSLLQANAVFRSTDDLSYDRDEQDRSKPASQNPLVVFDTVTSTEWTASRNSEGRISWLATLVPQFDISGAPSDNYTLSIVMLNDRTDLAVDKLSERVVFGTLQSVGTTGGEILLNSTDLDQLKLKPNDWIMLSGSYVLGAGQHVTRFQWYRVSDCDVEPELNAAGVYQLYATLVGSDWNPSFTSPPGVAIATGIPVNVTIVEGAFAVYEKTVRLEYGSAF